MSSFIKCLKKIFLPIHDPENKKQYLNSKDISFQAAVNDVAPYHKCISDLSSDATHDPETFREAQRPHW